jgi:hypothetical protein
MCWACLGCIICSPGRLISFEDRLLSILAPDVTSSLVIRSD